MDRIDELKSLIENCKKMIESSEKEIEMLESKEPAFERVEKGLRYYGIEVNWLGATAESYVDNRSVFSGATFKNNNYFLTKERAEEVADKINFLMKLERLHDTFCPDYKPDWEDKERECYWYVKFDSRTKRYEAPWSYYKVVTTAYFDSRETANKVCEILNKELEK